MRNFVKRVSIWLRRGSQSRRMRDQIYYSQRAQESWAQKEIPKTLPGLLMERQRIKRVQYLYTPLWRRLEEIEARILLANEPRHGVWLTAPRITHGYSGE